MTIFKRKILLVDGNVQGALVARVVAYWIACAFTVEMLHLTWQIATGPEQPTFFAYFWQQDLWGMAGRLALCGLLLVPITFDVLRLSNRFAGPVYRMQSTLRQVARGGEFTPIRLREGDFWHGFAADMNAALARLAAQRGQSSQHDTPTEEWLEPSNSAR